MLGVLLGAASAVSASEQIPPQQAAVPEMEELLEEKEELGAEVQQAIADLHAQLRRLHYLLSLVKDADTASSYEKEIQGALQGLKDTDLSVFENEDEERMADEFSVVFTILEEELSRLSENDYYGNQVIKLMLEEGESHIYTIGH